jgi:hypothetical protein
MAVWSEVPVSVIHNNYGRLDAEYFRPEYLQIDNILERFPIRKLKTITNKIDVGHVGPMVKHYCEDGILFIQTQQIGEFFLDLSACVKIDHSFHDFLKKSQVNSGNILIARSGSFGKASIYMEENVINSADIIIIDINKDQTNIDNLYLLTFLNSKYGSGQLIRYASGGLQGHVNLTILEDFKVPVISTSIQEEISQKVKVAYGKKVQSQSLYYQAKRLLESELGLDKLVFEKPIGYEASYSEVVSNNRADADYFQPKYRKIRENIKHYDHGWDYLLSLTTTLSPNIDPKKTPGNKYFYVELADIDSSLGRIVGKKLVSGASTPSRARRQIKVGDVIASAVVGSVDKAALVDKENSDCLASTGFFHFRPLTVSPEYLLILVRSLLVTTQLQQESTGGILSAVPDYRLKYVIVPRIPETIQKQISILVSNSHKAKHESEKLLDEAKRRVEDLLEEATSHEPIN